MVVDDEEKANILNTFFSTVFTVENEMLGEIPRNNENPTLRVTNLTKKSDSIATGSVPQDWRIANVVPIFKKGSKSEPGNYRPHGFMRNRSCQTNLISFYEEVSYRLDHGESLDVVYLDFSKAFDTVPHKSSEKEIWIRAKYVEKKFITKLPQTLLRSSTSHDKPPGRPLSTPETRMLETRSATGVKKWPTNSPGRQRDNSFLDITARKGNTEAGPDGKRAITRLKPKPQIRSKPGTAPPPPVGAKAGAADVATLHPGALLYRAAEHRYLPTMADALAHGADVNWVHSEEDGRTPLIQAVLSDSLVACEFLLQNGASVNQVDREGRGALHHATVQGYTG
ncbi:unnamed protein product [Ranitomeya imitator]|uniref:Arf-GAP with coiled-coil, ANK repeat and PH domain-containing protein n=1 Tax=Ranitomeya imitator TaxID=111125 RepID=A0ABN9L0I1_9NEOB|nr:unnamed protein product [Ranitomeya imitator]